MKSEQTLILVADAGSATFYKTGDRGNTIEKVDASFDAMPNPPSREHKSDRPGRSYESLGSRRGAIEPRSDPHKRAEADFAKVVARQLEDVFADGKYAGVAVFAPPIFLGELRKSFTQQLAPRIRAEINKDLTGSSIAAIQQHVRETLFPES